MSERLVSLLLELYRTEQKSISQDFAFKHAPILVFDENEPFLPLAAGYTIFHQDGPSPSYEPKFVRQVHLSPPGKIPAHCAIEYAIWWDWDIHHLYELERIWIYLDGDGKPLRVEASWHGDYHEIPVQIENDRVVLFSQPGKHAFAPSLKWFVDRAKECRRIETLAITAHAHVLIKSNNVKKVHNNIFDDTLVRSYLQKMAFLPSWDFSKKYTFKQESLVPWSVLEQWIPDRMNAILDHLQETITPDDFRPLYGLKVNATREDLSLAAKTGVDAFILQLFLIEDLLRIGESFHSPDIEEVFRFCSSEPIAVICEPMNRSTVEALADFMQKKGLQDRLLVTSDNSDLLSHLRMCIPDCRIAIQYSEPTADPIRIARECQAQFIHPRWENLPHPAQWMTSDWVRRIHQNGLGIISWPVRSQSESEQLRLKGVDILWKNTY